MHRIDHKISLDLIRGCSALLVLMNHLRATIFTPYHSLNDQNFVTSTFYAITSLGHQSVIIFFVLSGFFVGGSVLAKHDDFSWQEYILARLTRLWVVLIPALMATLIFDFAIINHAPAVLNGSQWDTWHLGPKPDGSYSLDFKTLIGNLFFLQEIITPVFGSNDPLWSLGYEFWYYIIFPTLLISIGYWHHDTKSRLAGLFVLLIIATNLPTNALAGFLCWSSGAGIHIVRQNFPSAKIPLPIGIAIFIFGLGLSFLLGKSDFPAFIADFSMALSTVALVTGIASRPKDVKLPPLLSFAARQISEISYSLYLIHFPIVLFIGTFYFNGSQVQPTHLALAEYLALMLLILSLAWCFWYVFERRTIEIRSALQRHLPSKEKQRKT